MAASAAFSDGPSVRLLISRNGVVNRQKVSEIRVIGRATQGVRLMALDQGDVIVDVARVLPEDEDPEVAALGDGSVAPASPEAPLAEPVADLAPTEATSDGDAFGYAEEDETGE